MTLVSSLGWVSSKFPSPWKCAQGVPSVRETLGMFHESSQALELCLSRSPPWEVVRGLPSAPKKGSKRQTVNMAAREQPRQHRPRNFRPRRDIFNEYDDTEFKKRYRVDRAGLLFVTDLVRYVIGNRSERSRAVTAELPFFCPMQVKKKHSLEPDLSPFRPVGRVDVMSGSV